jgi:hypothetical protein
MRSEVPEKETVVCSFRDVAGRCKGGRRIGVYPGTGRTRDWPERWLGWVPKRPSTSALALELTSTYDPPDASGAGVCPLPPVTRSAMEATSSAKAWAFTGAPPEPRDMVPRYVRTRVRRDEFARRSSYAASSATFERPLLFLVRLVKILNISTNVRVDSSIHAFPISIFLTSTKTYEGSFRQRVVGSQKIVHDKL